MGNIKEEAQAYEPPQTKNISELEIVSTDAEIVKRDFTKEDGSAFTVSVIIIDGEDYRIPNSVLKSLKVILEDNPDLKNFKVKKSGEGLKTEYTTIPIE